MFVFYVLFVKCLQKVELKNVTFDQCHFGSVQSWLDSRSSSGKNLTHSSLLAREPEVVEPLTSSLKIAAGVCCRWLLLCGCVMLLLDDLSDMELELRECSVNKLSINDNVLTISGQIGMRVT